MNCEWLTQTNYPNTKIHEVNALDKMFCNSKLA